MRHARPKVLVSVLVLVVAVVLAGRTGGGDVAHAAPLEPFENCDELLGYFTDLARDRVGAYGLDGGHAVPVPMPGVAEDTAVEAYTEEESARAPAAPAGGADSAHSGTNVQEAGVDEADVVKTDGRRLLVLGDGELRVVDVTGDAPRLAARLPVAGTELLLAGDRALVVSAGGGPIAVDTAAATAMPVAPPSGVELTLVDLAEAERPRIVATLRVDARYVGARMTGDVARLVVRSEPSLPFTFPHPGQSPDDAAAHNRRLVEESTIDAWVPTFEREVAAGGGRQEAPLVDCGEVHRPAEPAGLGVLSVLTLDLSADLAPAGAAAVVADAQTVYASPQHLYLAITRWDGAADPARGVSPGSETTEIHQFAIADAAGARYVASGRVRGRLLNQFALSEHAGHLRAATTTFDGGASMSGVTVLRPQGGTLTEVGHVGGLGRTEEIRAVRFLGDLGYVVTFRQVDPLFTLDLADPAAPRVAGELKIPGYSAYLHPVGDGLLLGVGQDATEQGQTLGLQLSLFDVRDLAQPRRTHQVALPQGSSAVEWDHRAFLWWPATRLVAVPVELWAMDQPGIAEPRPGVEPDMAPPEDASPALVRPAYGFAGVVVYTLDPAAGFTELGRVSHQEHAPDRGPVAIQRSLVIGDRLHTVSPAGVKTNDLATLAPVAWLPL